MFHLPLYPILERIARKRKENKAETRKGLHVSFKVGVNVSLKFICYRQIVKLMRMYNVKTPLRGMIAAFLLRKIC